MRFGEIGAGQVRFIRASDFEKRLSGERGIKGVADAEAAPRRIMIVGRNVVVCIFFLGRKVGFYCLGEVVVVRCLCCETDLAEPLDDLITL